MGFTQRIWIPDDSSDTKTYPDRLHIYDAGNFIGYLTEKNGRKQKQWAGFSVLSRVKNSSTVEETLAPAHEFEIPMNFFSIETYPAFIESASLLWIPGWKIRMSRAHESEEQPQQGSRPEQPLPAKQTKHPKPSQPSPRPAQSYPLPSSHPPPRSPSGKQGQSPRSSQNKNNSASKPKASPSSNQVSHEMQKQSTQGKSGEPPSLSSLIDHISPLSQWYPLSHVSLSPQPQTKHEESNPQSTSSSQNHSSSKQHSPSQQVPHRRGGKSRRPIVSQPSSHE